MSKNSAPTFEVVPDSLRTAASAETPETKALIEGKTLRINQRRTTVVGRLGRKLKPLGYKLHTHADGEDHVIYWATQEEAKA